MPARAGAEAAPGAATFPLNLPRSEKAVLGILFMIAATAMFAASSAIMKHEAGRYPIGETMAFRSISSLLVCALAVLPTQGWGVFATAKPGAHVARGLSQSVSQTFTVIALTLMPMAGAIAIGFSAPLFSAMISILWLKERADKARLAALAAGFLGVLIVTRPGAGTFQLGALFALANAVMYGSVTVAVRSMTRTESTMTLLMWQMATVAAFHTLLLAFGFVTPTPRDAAILFGSGAANAIGQYCWTRSLGLAPATVVSPFYYLLLVWALGIGFVVWGDIPTPSLLMGSGIVVASGLALLLREMNRNPGVKAADPPAAPSGRSNAEVLAWPGTRGGDVRSLGGLVGAAGDVRREVMRQGMGTAQQEALDGGAAELGERPELLLRLHTLRDRLHAEAGGEIDDGAQGRLRLLALADIVNELTIDLERIDRVEFEIAQAGIAGSKIVDRYAHAHRADLAQLIDDALMVLHEHGFRDLDMQALRRQPRESQSVADGLCEIRCLELHRRRIDREAHVAG